LKAVLTADEPTALTHAARWLERNDIDTASFAEHRLLAALADRFGNRLSSQSAFPRLIGLQKLLWSKSNLALGECRTTLAALAAAGCTFMVIKGAARTATDPSAMRGRVAHDIDILLQPANMRTAVDILLDEGWQAFSGAGPRRIRQELAVTRSLNFFRGTGGDLDLHSAAYHLAQESPEDDAELWKRAVPVVVAGAAALAPSPSDRIAMAIAHGSLGAHSHSDWLVDVAAAISQDHVDWDALLLTLDRRRLLVPAASALGYLRSEVGINMPEAMLRELVERADRSGPLRFLALLEAKPRSDFNLVSATARAVAKHVRLWRERPRTDSTERAEWRAWRARPADGTPENPDLIATLPVPDGYRSPGTRALEVVLRIRMPDSRRRIELELSTASRHLARLRYLKTGKQSGPRDLTFRGKVDLSAGEDALVLESRPSRNFRFWRDAQVTNDYGALPFSVVRATWR
jgi:hypothetical protein